jgi:glycerophosphoryl diester phosphodiesterase
MLKIGHRGACGYEPENTLLSFDKALELGVDAVELDVHRLKDGKVVVIHDRKVNRTTNGKGHVTNKCFKEIRKLRVGKSEKIPLLEEVLDLIDRRIEVNIELKGKNTALAVSRIVNYYIKLKGWKEDHFFVSSFDHEELIKFKNELPAIRICPLVKKIPKGYAKFGENMKAYSINVFYKRIGKKFIEDAHRRKIKVFAWTINKPNDIVKIKKLEVDGIISDYPDRI